MECQSWGGGGVKKEKGVVSNPYLENLDIQTLDGAIYTQKNPALMTREISEYTENAGDFKYHITSLLPLNPDNAADAFEKDALTLFENGQQEQFAMIDHGNSTEYRYMAPLFVEKGCLSCHAKQGYHVGDVRGGISVSFDVTEIHKKLQVNRYVFVGLSIIVSLLLLVAIFLLVSRVAKKLSDAYSMIEKMSVTDELTQLYNRRHFHTRLEEEIQRAQRYRHPLSLVLPDIDHFKKVNDVHGHQVGDEVLKGVASVLESNVRKIDIVSRYGGEEMVIILPETDRNGAFIVAEKHRGMIEGHFFDLSEGEKLTVTASFGVSTLDNLPEGTDDNAKQIIKLADEALYMAKHNGRNRVVLST